MIPPTLSLDFGSDPCGVRSQDGADVGAHRNWGGAQGGMRGPGKVLVSQLGAESWGVFASWKFSESFLPDLYNFL